MEAVRAANRTRQPEDSVALRAAVLLTVIAGAVALAVVQAISIATLVMVVIALSVAYFVSYKRRHEDNWAIKIAVTFLAIFALVRFFNELGQIATLDEVRFPLADLFLWVQVLHGFDLPARKDLNFSLGSSLTLIAAAGSISQDLWYGIVLLIYFGLAIAALALAYRSEVTEGTAGVLSAATTGPAPETRPQGTWDMAKALAVTAAAGTILFLVIPQPQAVRTFALPFALGGGIGIDAAGGVANPGFPGGTTPGSRSNNAAYYGFNNRMDLRVRGSLTDDVVFRVRSSAPAMWRGMIFDEYTGVAWEGDLDTHEPVIGDPPYHYPVEYRSLGPRATLSSTFYIEHEQPSFVFAGGQPETIWIEGGVSYDDNGSVRTPSTLTAGTVYSVVSSRGAATPQELRTVPEVTNLPEAMQPYLQLPPVPQRVHDLAEEITAGTTNNYDKVKAIEAWLAENYRYHLDSPVPPDGQDAVDHFLFETDVGFCEQFASATAIMLRTLDVPTRVVAGYTPGTKNPFTGYHEVKNSDAHSWVEVWFPRYGWYEFDPTFAIPPAEGDFSESVPMAKVISFLSEKFEDLVPPNARDLVRTAFFILLAAIVLISGRIAWRRLRPHRPAVAPDVLTAGAGPVTRAFRRFEESLAREGRARRPAETAAELIKRATMHRPPSGVTSALGAFERERYGAEGPNEREVQAAVEELDRLAGAGDRS
jgi:transglutaminase-like putative cysteine protease